MTEKEKTVETNEVKVDETLEEMCEDLEFDKNEHFIGNLSFPAKVAIGFVFGLLCFTAGLVFGVVVF